MQNISPNGQMDAANALLYILGGEISLKIYCYTFFWLCISIVLLLYIEVLLLYIKKEGACKISARTARWMQQTHCYTFCGVKCQKNDEKLFFRNLSRNILGYFWELQDNKKQQKTYSRTSIDGRVF